MPKPPALSQEIFDKSRRFKRLVFQKGKNVTDFEVNEAQQILHGFQSDTRKFLGGWGFLGDGFLPEPNGNDSELRIRSGLLLAGEQVIYLAEDETILGLPTPASNVQEYVYVVISEEYFDSTDYADILDPVTSTEKALRLGYSLTFGVTSELDFPAISAADTLVVFARLTRRIGDDSVLANDVIDYRPGFAETFVRGISDDSFKLTNPSGASYSIEAGSAYVYGTSVETSAVTGTFTPSALSFVYLNSGGSVVVSTTRPTGFHTELYRVSVNSLGSVTNIEDRRRWQPGGLVGVFFDEVVEARGTKPRLDARLDVILEEDGTARGGSIASKALKPFYVSAQTTPSLFVDIQAGSINLTDRAIQKAQQTVGPFTIPATNPRIDLVYLNSMGVAQIAVGTEAAVPEAPDHSNRVPLAEILFNPSSSVITNSMIKDVRPIFFLDTSPDTPLRKKLHQVLDSSSMEYALTETFASAAFLDGSSTGSLLSEGQYELSAGEFVLSDFGPPLVGGTIASVIPVVLTNTGDPLEDLQIEVNRGGGLETADRTHQEYSFTGGGTNDLQIKITNTSGGTVVVAAYAILYSKLTNSSVSSHEESGLVRDISGGGARLFSTDPSPCVIRAVDIDFEYDSTANTLSWDDSPAAVGGAASWIIETVGPAGVVQNTVANASSVSSVVPGSYVYADLNPAGGSVTLQVSAGAPEPKRHRVIIGSARTNAGRDVFEFSNGALLYDTDLTGFDATVQGYGNVGSPTPKAVSYAAWERQNLLGDLVWWASSSMAVGTYTDWPIAADTKYIKFSVYSAIKVVAGISGSGAGHYIINLTFSPGPHLSGVYTSDTTHVTPGYDQGMLGVHNAVVSSVTLLDVRDSSGADIAAITLTSLSFTPGVGGTLRLTTSSTGASTKEFAGTVECYA